MSNNWIIQNCEDGGIALPCDEIEDLWRTSALDYAMSLDFMEESFAQVMSKIGIALGTNLSSLEIELFLSGITLEEIFGSRLYLGTDVSRPVESFDQWQASRCMQTELKKNREVMLKILVLYIAAHNLRHLERVTDHKAKETRVLLGEHRPETWEPKWGKPMEKYLSPKKAMYCMSPSEDHID